MFDKKTKVIAIVSPKGGAGKTTITANLGVVFSMYGKKTLVLDTNVTTASLGLHFGLVNPPVTFKDVLDQNFHLSKAIYTYNAKLHVIPSALSLEIKYKPLTLQDKIRKLTNHYNILLTELVKKYDFILLDSAPGFNAESIAAMLASDGMIMITNPDLPSVIATAKGVEYAKLLKRPVFGIVLNRVKYKSYELHRDEIEKAIGVKIISEIPEDENVSRALACKIPLVDFKSLSKASTSYKELGALLLNQQYHKSFAEKIMRFVGI